MKALLVFSCLCLPFCLFSQSERAKGENDLLARSHRYGSKSIPEPTAYVYDSVKAMTIFFHGELKKVRGRPSVRRKRLADIMQLERLNISLLGALNELSNCGCEDLSGMDTVSAKGTRPPKHGDTTADSIITTRRLTYDTDPLRATRAQSLMLLTAQNTLIDYLNRLGDSLTDAQGKVGRFESTANNNQIRTGNQLHHDLCEIRRNQWNQIIYYLVIRIEESVINLKVDYYRRYRKLLKANVL